MSSLIAGVAAMSTRLRQRLPTACVDVRVPRALKVQVLPFGSQLPCPGEGVSIAAANAPTINSGSPVRKSDAVLVSCDLLCGRVLLVGRR